ncbi:FAD-dependent oxidoreductase [Psychrobacter pygoscelis]|uniref:FAD-dependent oxidoreductase n=1 Tax=Psychrobacter pygoscelis TaxID=2488563 RepID=UPI00103FB644|nr:FAD-dependent oxidoreductase [Psychrobacter pygoscelis]
MPNTSSNAANCTETHKKRVLIAGGGISGLSAAFELSEDPNLDITVVESKEQCGGKMIGYFNAKEQRFEEHSIRALGATYFSLFNIFSRANLLHTLTPVDDYQFYQSEPKKDNRGKSDNVESHSGRRISVDRRKAIDLQTIENMIEAFDLNKKNMLQLVQRIVHHVNASEEQRQKMEYEKAGDFLGIDDFDEHTRQFITNWFGILTGARMHSKAVDIMDSFVLMFLPMTEAPTLPAGEPSKSYCFNRPTSEVIDALVETLKQRGVKFYNNTHILNLHRHTEAPSDEQLNNSEHTSQDRISIDVSVNPLLTDKTSVEDLEALEKQYFDAAVIALPHEVIWKLGLLPEVKKPFNDEWSFGTQYPLQEIPEVFKPFMGKSYSLCFDAPWNIVFQIQHKGGFWQDVEFPEGHDYNLSATCSSPFNKGSLYGKRFMECTPEEAKEEILYQLGITDKQQYQQIAATGVIDPINLIYTDNWQPYAELETAEMGIEQDNGKRWVNLTQIYIRNADDAKIETKTQWNNIVLAGEIISVKGRWKIPTMEQAATSGKQAAQAVFDYFDCKRHVDLATAELVNESYYKYLDPLITALSTAANKVSKIERKITN